ncbi:hypothetical protein HMPREF9120_01895 [Neisseria sp. oral taxon 020 str. F0370]|nr:hypothetical protein HMPREF9120_01895 [Neisseria sp. oral taxon 020 str. F0370]
MVEVEALDVHFLFGGDGVHGGCPQCWKGADYNAGKRPSEQPTGFSDGLLPYPDGFIFRRGVF